MYEYHIECIGARDTIGLHESDGGDGTAATQTPPTETVSSVLTPETLPQLAQTHTEQKPPHPKTLSCQALKSENFKAVLPCAPHGKPPLSRPARDASSRQTLGR